MGRGNNNREKKAVSYSEMNRSTGGCGFVKGI